MMRTLRSCPSCPAAPCQTSQVPLPHRKALAQQRQPAAGRLHAPSRRAPAHCLSSAQGARGCLRRELSRRSRFLFRRRAAPPLAIPQPREHHEHRLRPTSHATPPRRRDRRSDATPSPACVPGRRERAVLQRAREHARARSCRTRLGARGARPVLAAGSRRCTGSVASSLVGPDAARAATCWWPRRGVGARTARGMAADGSHHPRRLRWSLHPSSPA